MDFIILKYVQYFPEICQVRLDFINGNFAQPDATTGNCETGDRDTLTLDAGGDDPTRLLCGDLTGQHSKLSLSILPISECYIFDWIDVNPIFLFLIFRTF